MLLALEFTIQAVDLKLDFQYRYSAAAATIIHLVRQKTLVSHSNKQAMLVLLFSFVLCSLFVLRYLCQQRALATKQKKPVALEALPENPNLFASCLVN
jgi:hypothetical protein